MYHQPILDLAEFEPAPRGAAPVVPLLRRPRVLIAALVVVAALLALAGMNLVPADRPAPPQALRIALPDQQAVAQMSVDDKAQIVVEGSDAERRNALIPVMTQPVEQARRFLIAMTAAAEPRTALRCLTQAVYYEAAYEPMQGRRAVAQVVLNRVRHPAYPKSVCGVVYQGSERVTGCQFSFTCDGALLRAPAAAAWREAETVARAALAGYVEPSVGTATHYHADYVLPKWAFQLGKIAQLGRHIFYRFPGGWGRPAAFSGQYSGIERIPAMNLLAHLIARLVAVVLLCLVGAIGWVMVDAHRTIERETAASADRMGRHLEALYWQKLVWRGGMSKDTILPLPDWETLSTLTVIAPGVCVSFAPPGNEPRKLCRSPVPVSPSQAHRVCRTSPSTDRPRRSRTPLRLQQPP